MCTVTYLPPSAHRGYILTSNRDERDFRPTLPPATYRYNNNVLGFPKDEKAGGSWVAVNGNGRIACLLNGAYLAHKKQGFHTMSRGLVLLELVSATMALKEFFLTKELGNVEPFTMVTMDGNGESGCFDEFVWDGANKYVRELDKHVPQIWSSVTLYSEEQRMLRKDWFNRFHSVSGNNISPENVMSFHTGMHSPDPSVNVVMNREGGMRTVSITQITAEKEKIKLHYVDLLNHSKHQLFL